MITIQQGNKTISIAASEVAAIIVNPFDPNKLAPKSYSNDMEDFPEDAETEPVVPAVDAYSKVLLKNGMTLRVSEANAKLVGEKLAA